MLSGPKAQQAPVLASLNRTGVNLSEGQPEKDPSYGCEGDQPEPTVGWVTCRHADVDQVAATAARHRWVLRLHWPTPSCRVCPGTGLANGEAGLQTCGHCDGTGRTNRTPPDSTGLLLATIDDLKARLAKLEAGRR